MVISVSAFADTNYNNFTGYSAYWHPLGNPDTATYGETFTAPTNEDSNLKDFGFYLAGPIVSGNIIMSAYIATWTGFEPRDTPLYKPIGELRKHRKCVSLVRYRGLALTPGASYVVFLSVSQYYGQSSGESYVSSGGATIPGGAFVYIMMAETLARFSTAHGTELVFSPTGPLMQTLRPRIGCAGTRHHVASWPWPGWHCSFKKEVPEIISIQVLNTRRQGQKWLCLFISCVDDLQSQCIFRRIELEKSIKQS